MKVKEGMNSTHQMNPHFERKELGSRDLMDTEKHHHQTPQGFSQIKLHIYSTSTTKEHDLDLKDHPSKKPT